MTTQELRELDAWIAEHVMGWTEITAYRKHGPTQFGKDPLTFPKTGDFSYVPDYSSNPADAMDVLNQCAEKMRGRNICFRQRNADWGTWRVTCDFNQAAGESETLELAICLFAKQLFSK